MYPKLLLNEFMCLVENILNLTKLVIRLLMTLFVRDSGVYGTLQE